MTDADRLLDDIAAEPADPAARLVLADWLEEQGGPVNAARARLLRWQVEWEQLSPRDRRRRDLEQAATEVLGEFPPLAGPLAGVADASLPLLAMELALVAFLTAEVAAPSQDDLGAGSTWEGELSQDGRTFPTKLRVTSRTGNAFTGELELDFGYGHGHFSFEGVLLAGRLVFLVTDKLAGAVTYPGLYTAELHTHQGTLEGTWRVPSYSQQGPFCLRRIP
jgi:uncharacterized protein (TIGR02996 family)